MTAIFRFFSIISLLYYSQVVFACIDISLSRDSDVTRNKFLLSTSNICYNAEGFLDGGADWMIQSFTNTAKKVPITVFAPHDDEQEAFDAGAYAIHKYGGSFLAINAYEERENLGIDPNRYFSLDKQHAKNCGISATASARYTERVLKAFPSQLYITLHNNRNGGKVSSSHYTAKAKFYPSTQSNVIDEDDFVYMTGVLPKGGMDKTLQLIRAINAQGINIVYEVVTPSNNDCSFSNVVALNNLGLYFNIEAEHGHGLVQRQILDGVMTSVMQFL
jgi:hypothetical protein